jgi:hypothetical protein
MIIKRFLNVNSNEIVIFKVNVKLKYEKFWVFVTFYKNLYLSPEPGQKKLWLRLQQKVVAPPAPAPQHCIKQCCSEFLNTGTGIKKI